MIARLLVSIVTLLPSPASSALMIETTWLTGQDLEQPIVHVLEERLEVEPSGGVDHQLVPQHHVSLKTPERHRTFERSSHAGEETPPPRYLHPSPPSGGRLHADSTPRRARSVTCLAGVRIFSPSNWSGPPQAPGTRGDSSFIPE